MSGAFGLRASVSRHSGVSPISTLTIGLSSLHGTLDRFN